MSKKKKWWQKGLNYSDLQLDESKFSNTIKQHQQRQQRMFDSDGIEYFDEDDYAEYDWGLSKKLSTKTEGEEEKKKKGTYDTSWSDEYKKTGVWRGYDYYRTPQLSYKYVQQMANALAAQHRITVEVGNHWQVDLLKKKLIYNPATLIYGTKSELLATLLHEIGKLRYVTHTSHLNNKYHSMYPDGTRVGIIPWEDVRVDYMMLQAYESASEIYESAIPAVERQTALFNDLSKQWRSNILLSLHNHYDHCLRSFQQNQALGKQQTQFYFGTTDIVEVELKLREFKDYISKNGNLYDYNARILEVMYDLDKDIAQKYTNTEEIVDLTIPAIDLAKKNETSQQMVDETMDAQVYPHIEVLFKDFTDENEALKKVFPNMSKEARGQMVNNAKQQNGGLRQDELSSQVRMSQKMSNESRNTVPPEWRNGDYKVLKDSVLTEIKQLINRLTFIRREELVQRFTQDQKRGKLNSRKLYKSKTGSRRLFKQKLERPDTVQSFAFSLLLDVSGSMDGPRIIHSTRASIILAEVFQKMDIPFEYVIFDNNAKVLKTFDQNMDSGIEKKIGGLVKRNGGGTNLHLGLESLKIHSRPEKNKVVIVLSDGGVHDIKSYDTKYFEPWAKKGIKSIGIGVECEKEMEQLAMGNSKVLGNANQLPVEFTNILKTLIKKR